MKKLLSVVMSLFLLIGLTLPMFSAYHTTTYRISSDHLTLFSDNSGASLLSYRGGECHYERLTPSTGSADLHLNHSITAAGVFGDTIVTLCNDTDYDQLVVYTYHSDTDVLDSFTINGLQYYTDCGFYYYNNSEIFLLSDRSSNIIEQYSTSGLLRTRYTFNSTVSQIGRDYRGNMFAVCAKTLYYWNGSRFTACGGSSVSVPVTWFSDNLLSDSSGKVYRIQNSSCNLLFTASADFGKTTPCIIDDVVYYPVGKQIYGYRITNGEKLSEISLSDSIIGLYAYRGKVYAVSDSVSPVVAEIRPDEFTDLTLKQPSPQQNNASPSPDNNNADGNSSDPDYIISSSVYRIDYDSYRISNIPAGTTFAQLKQNITHNGYNMSLYRDGSQKEYGNCGTAMTVVFDSDRAKYTFELSVIGDITGEGNVNSRDHTRLMEYLIGSYWFNGVYLLSADLSGDGVVDVKDLALLHRMI